MFLKYVTHSKLCAAIFIVVVGQFSLEFLAEGAVVHGNWSPWSQFSEPCSKTCGGGQHKKFRTCTNPEPEGGGRGCQNTMNLPADREEKTFPCATESCWSFDPVWEDWRECSVKCGRGIQKRSPNCTGDTGCGSIIPPDEERDCNTWNRANCPNPCDDFMCQDFAICNDVSDDEDPKTKCTCVLDYKLTKQGKCKRPPPTTPTERPIPTLPAEQKMVATVISKSASSVLIFFVTLTLILFCVMRIFTVDRIIQMNMEIALLAAHLFLLFPPSTVTNVTLCKIVSILLHYLFLACFMFMMLESVHMYSLVAYVVKRDGLFCKIQNLIIGWGVPAVIVGVSVAFEWDNYGGEYHCWLQMNKNVMIAQQLPIIVLMLMTFTLIEAAGEADYKPMKGMDKKQVMSAKFSQRTNLIILPFVYAHWVLGTLSEYQQNLALYGIFSVVNGWLGACVFFLHCSNNQQVREKLKSLYNNLRSD